ncbi:hypothetical protein KW868_02590 [Acinetobacter guillouiae]|uniref:Uncharacterized protein n=1 Tax=Acinetobacter guillouiae TaxID=106649 RepID=A0A8X8GBU5_ACIGI|nr:hypothetical protein [Acinetobacter guillouiae]MCF0263363.1 hypothetical protein [Acinetobacter guillouiae]
MNKHIPCESDLTSAVPETWANAVMCCKTGNPYCGADGYCHADGACFELKELTLGQALVEIEHLKKELSETRVKNTQIESKHLNVIARLNRAKDMALKDGKSERLFAIRQTLAILERGDNANS